MLFGCIFVAFSVFLHRTKLTEGPAVGVVANVALISGLVLFILSCFGFYAVKNENYCMLITYGIILILLSALSLYSGVRRKLMYSQWNEDVEEVFRSYNTDEDYMDTFNEIQSQLGCCGLNGFEDYGKMWGNEDLPESCCMKIVSSMPCFTGAYHYKVGCAEKLDVLEVDGNFGIFLSVVVLTAAGLSFYLGVAVKDKPEECEIPV